MNNILYVTSFNKKLFDATGRDMVSSFLAVGVEGDLLVTYEDGIKDEIPQGDNILLLDLDSHDFLHDWIQKHKDSIPTEYGGTMEGCDCASLPTSEHYLKNHVRRCPNLGFNRRSSLWFRKIVAMNHALNLSDEKGYSKIIFIDSDVVVKNKITEDFINKVFGNNGFFFHLGAHRKRIETGIESGFIGFSKDNRGYDFLNIVIDKFKTDDFKKYDRWDDGYIFRKAWEEHPEIPSRDVVGPHQLKPYAHVVKYGLFAKYIAHDKGSHMRKYKIFKDSTGAELKW